MKTQRCCPLVILPALLLAGCATDVRTLLSKDELRRQAIDTLVGDPSMRGQVVERLLSGPADRSALFQRIVEDDQIAAAMIQHMMQNDRGPALVASQIASNRETTRTFMRALMLTGAVGEILTQEQAERLQLGQAFAHGNQMRTMHDLKRLGEVVDGWAREKRAYPVCDRDDDVSGCLAALLPEKALDDMRLTDAWGRPFQYRSEDGGKSYTLVSYATDGLYDRLGKAGPTSSYDADIVFSNGDFVQWPGSIRKDTIR